MQVGHLFRTTTTCDKVIHHTRAQRSRPVKGYRRDKVGKTGWRNILNEVRHAAGLHLEHGARASLAEHLRGQLIRKRNAADIDFFAPRFLNVREAVTNHRERAQAEEVHFQ